MRTLRSLFVGLVSSAIWPAFIGLVAYVARQAPWPRSVAVLASNALSMLALAAFAATLLAWIFSEGGWAENELGVPADVARQARRLGFLLVAAHVLFLLPVYLLAHGLVAPGGRPVTSPMVVRVLILAFEAYVLALAFWLTGRNSAVVGWIGQSPDRLGWLTRHRRLLALTLVVATALVLVLDAMGFSYSSWRLANGLSGSILSAVAAWGVYRVLVRGIDRQAWRWIRLGKALAGMQAPGESGLRNDLAVRLRLLSGYFAAGCGLLLASRAWDVDLALFGFISKQDLWAVDADVSVNVGDLTRMLVVLWLTGLVWKHIGTFFAVVVFPRMPDDPGVRFAVVTLCRYAALGIGLICGLSSIHLGLEKISMVLAALGVGLGFGLQEIVSNFVCGIILLLERPIRVGDIVTVSSMTGKVDRINIRATTITNGDNQSMIVPNRAFITGDLVNWTLKDKIIRVSVKLRVAHGTDPDRVSDLLLAIALADPDVLRNPMPSAYMEEFSESSLIFILHAYVPDPGLGGRVRHRLFAAIQRRFADEGIHIPLPTQKLLVKSDDPGESPALLLSGELHRVDRPGYTPPIPRFVSRPGPATEAEPQPIDEGHRGVDE